MSCCAPCAKRDATGAISARPSSMPSVAPACSHWTQVQASQIVGLADAHVIATAGGVQDGLAYQWVVRQKPNGMLIGTLTRGQNTTWFVCTATSRVLDNVQMPAQRFSLSHT